MRYYDIIVRLPTPPTFTSATLPTQIGQRVTLPGTLWVPPSMEKIKDKIGKMPGQASYSSLYDGKHNPSALNVGMDIPLGDAATQAQGAHIRIQGCGLRDISAAPTLVGGTCDVLGGMSEGLDLATATVRDNQPGPLIKGTVWMAYGNKVAQNSWLDLIVMPIPQGIGQKLNITFDWKQGQQLQEALAGMLGKAFPTLTPKWAISNLLVGKSDQHHTNEEFSTFAEWLKDYTAREFPNITTEDGGVYQGVKFLIVGQDILISDDSKTAEGSAVKQLKFQDLVGQPSWLGLNVLQVKVVLRGDITPILTKVKLPPELATNPRARILATEAGQPPPPVGGPSSPLPQTDINTLVQGSYKVLSLHHFANFRQPTGEAWVTVINLLIPAPPPIRPPILPGTPLEVIDPTPKDPRYQPNT
jgi:hypothetical protein